MTHVVPAVVEGLAPTGTLRASINLGNPVLAQGTATSPTGVTVDLSQELGRQLGVPVNLRCFDAARKSFEAMAHGEADVCYLAIDPKREEQVAFTAAYVVIEGVFAVATDSPIITTADVDQEHVRVGVKQGSAYDLYLSRTLQRASVVQGDEGIDVYRDRGLEVAAGIRQPMTDYVASHPGLRLLAEPFMEIRQAMGTTKDRHRDAVAFLRAFVEEAKASGFVAESLRRAGLPPELAVSAEPSA